jgi:cytochrome c-type biogenesis protein CcmH
VRKLTPAILVVVLLLLAQVVYAQDGPTQDDVNAVARKLFCPVCENTPLDVCPTEACQQWRDVIRTKLIEGQSEDEILDYFAEMYGDSVLAQPPPRQVLAWFLPVVIVLVAVVALAFWLRSWTRPEMTTVPVDSVDDDLPQDANPYIERIEQELAEWEL